MMKNKKCKFCKDEGKASIKTRRGNDLSLIVGCLVLANSKHAVDAIAIDYCPFCGRKLED